MTPSSNALETLEPRIAPATFTVLNNDDMGVGSLRDAIEQANADPRHDTIRFAKNVFGDPDNPLTISLNSQLEIESSLTIRGPGAGQLTIDGGSSTFRVFDIDDGNAASNSRVTLDRIAVTGGNVVAGAGGGIYSAENLTLRNSTVTGNSANSGGGIFVNGPVSTKIENSRITGNAASLGGGGISADVGDGSGPSGDLLLRNVIIAGNDVSVTGGGGFIELKGEGSSVTIVKSVIASNTAGGTAGGLEILNSGTDSKTLIRDTQVTGNNAVSMIGGLNLSNAMAGNTMDTLIRSTTLSGNSAGEVGGLAISARDTDSVRLIGLEVLGNGSDAGNTGGMLVSGNGDIDLRRATIQGNHSAVDSGGLRHDGTAKVSIRGSEISGNSATVDGGGISVTNGILEVMSSSISGNRAAILGGGIDAGLGSNIEISRSTFTGNTSSYGGAVNASAATVEISRSTFASNMAAFEGGALFLDGLNASSLKHVELLNNRSEGLGGGLSLRNMAQSFEIISSNISGNSAGTSGGGAYLQSIDNIIVTKSRFEHNSSSIGDAGALMNAGNSVTTIDRTKFFENFATMSGGGIKVFLGAVEVNRSDFRGNSAGSEGGAIDGSVVLNRTRFSDNFAPVDPVVST